MKQTNIAPEKESPWLETLVGKNFLEKVLCSFSKSTGLKALLVDTKGNTLISASHELKDCSFCSKIKADSLGLQKCQRSYARACTEAAKYGEPYIFRCHAGLIMWAAPIVLDQDIFSIICGQVLMWEPEDYFLEEIEEMVKGLKINIASVKWAAAQLEVMSSDRVQAAADLLFVVANQIMKNSLSVLEQRRNITAQQARLAEEIQVRKHSEAAKRTVKSKVTSTYSLDKENELKTLVRNGEKQAAQQILEKFLVDILERNSEHIETVKTRVAELVVVISRAAVDGGADLSVILQQNALLYLDLLKLTHTDEVCLWSRDMLETYLKHIEINSDRRNQQAIQNAAEYIQKNFRSKITIEDIARFVYLSPCYVSRIFKKGLGCTLMEYLTKVRVEEAKKMLKNPKYNVMKVAEESGFEDPAYFTRVFKKSEGITPSSYRQQCI